MELDLIKLHTTWNNAAGSINTNFSKIQIAIASLEGGSDSLNEDELLAFLVENGYITTDDLSDYYTKYEVNELIDQIKAGDIDLANYYTKEEIDGKGFLTSASLVGYAKTADVDAVVDRVKLLEDAGYATTGYVSEAISDLNIGQFATKTALAATVEALNAEIGKKANADNVADTYATKTALSTVDNRLVSIESYFATSEDAGNQIDKWNEIVAFLNATEGTTLAGILAAYYTKTEVDSKVTTLDNKYAPVKTWYDALGSLIVKDGDNVRIKTNLIVEGDTASGGESGDTVVVGATSVVVNGVSYPATDGVIDLSGAFDGVLTSVSWENVDGRPTALSQFTNDLNLGSLAYKNGLTASDVGALSLSGGTISGASDNYTPLIVKTTSLPEVWIAFRDTVGITYIGSSRGVPSISNGSENKTILHSGNYSDYALPLSGGTIEGSVHIKSSTTNPLAISSSSGVQSGATWFINGNAKSWFGYDNGTYMYDYAHAATLGIATDGVPKFNNNTLYHSGNLDPSIYLRKDIGGDISGNVILRSGSLGFYKANGQFRGYLGATGDNTSNNIFWYNNSTWNTLLHSGNYATEIGDYYLKSTGGTMGANAGIGFRAYNAIDGGGGWAIDALTLYNRNQDKKMGAVSFHGGGNELYYIYIGVNAYNGNNLRIYPSSVRFGDNHILHSGNVGEYALQYYGTNMPADIVNYVGYGKTETGWKEYGPAITFGISSYYTQIQRRLNTNKYYVRGYDDGTYTEWKTIAFTDSDITGNAATATRARYIETLDASGKLWYGDSYRLYGQWITSDILELKVNGYKTLAWQAKELATARTIWGRSFDGTTDITDPAKMQVLYFVNRDGTTQSYIGRASGASDDIILEIPTANGFRVVNNGGLERFRVNKYGNVTIGSSDLASTSYNLYVSGNTCIGYNGIYGEGNESMLRGSANAISIGYGYRNLTTDIYGGTIRFLRGEGTTSMLINSSGNVGINTPSPQYRLDVDGSGRFTESLVSEGTFIAKGSLEVYGSMPYIDFHFGNATDDYTSRIIEIASGNLAVYANWLPNTNNARKLGNSDRRWSEIFGVNGNLSGTLNVGGASTFNGDVHINGNLIVSGDTASGGTGEGIGATLTIQYPPDGSSITQAQLDAVGLTESAIAGILNGQYHHVIIQWGGMDYLCSMSGRVASDATVLFFRCGDANVDDWTEWHLKKNSDGTWTVLLYEI